MATTAREDTWPIDGLCIYNYQPATQVDNRQVHPSLTEPNRKPGLRLAKHPKSLTDSPSDDSGRIEKPRLTTAVGAVVLEGM